jgi:LPXTG-motif cell wall-anchored protein
MPTETAIPLPPVTPTPTGTVSPTTPELPVTGRSDGSFLVPAVLGGALVLSGAVLFVLRRRRDSAAS